MLAPRALLRVPVSGRVFARGLASGVNQPYQPNARAMPPFKPQDNQSRKPDMGLHSKPQWSAEECQSAMKANSIFTWGASGPLSDACVLIDRAEGVYMYDKQGKRYYDWSAGAVCTNLGHDVPEAVKTAVAKQLEQVAFVYGDLATTEIRARLSKLLADIAPGDLNSVLFASGGAEANEAAMRMARRFTGRPKIISRHRSYHGGTTSALGLTGDNRTWFVNLLSPGFVKMADPFPFLYKWDQDPSAASERCLDALHEQLLAEGPTSVAAIFLESVTGANGWLMPDPKFVQGVRALCDKYGILLVFDEVMAGFGRTGRMFGFEHYQGVLPDMFTFAKGVSSAYLPLSGVMARDHVFKFFQSTPLGYGSTYNSHPTVCAAAYEAIKHLISNNVVDNVRKMEGVMIEELSALVSKHPSIKQARCVGLGAGFDLCNKDGDFLVGMDGSNSDGLVLFKKRLVEEGVVTLVRGHHVHCTPPLVINEEQIRDAFVRIHKAADSLDEWILKQ